MVKLLYLPGVGLSWNDTLLESLESRRKYSVIGCVKAKVLNFVNSW